MRAIMRSTRLPLSRLRAPGDRRWRTGAGSFGHFSPSKTPRKTGTFFHVPGVKTPFRLPEALRALWAHFGPQNRRLLGVRFPFVHLGNGVGAVGVGAPPLRRRLDAGFGHGREILLALLVAAFAVGRAAPQALAVELLTATSAADHVTGGPLHWCNRPIAEEKAVAARTQFDTGRPGNDLQLGER